MLKLAEQYPSGNPQTRLSPREMAELVGVWERPPTGSIIRRDPTKEGVSRWAIAQILGANGPDGLAALEKVVSRGDIYVALPALDVLLKQGSGSRSAVTIAAIRILNELPEDLALDYLSEIAKASAEVPGLTNIMKEFTCRILAEHDTEWALDVIERQVRERPELVGVFAGFLKEVVDREPEGGESAALARALLDRGNA